MRRPRRLWSALAAVFLACAGAENEAPIPSRADSGFRMESDAFSFENFADGYGDSVLTADLLGRMFGDEVCTTKNPACQLTPAARIWMNRQNAAMAGGRCEGFVVLSSLLYSGSVDPSALGGPVTRQLSLDGNVPLQRELAYWYATQGVPDALAVKKFEAKEALRFLSTFLAPGADEFYRIGIVKRTRKGFAGGHALTPIRYEPGSAEGVFDVHVYDNNFPDEERILTVDAKAGRWEYRGGPNPDAPTALYTGDAKDHNPLYFASIKTRLGTLPLPFGKDSAQSEVSFQGAVDVAAHDEAGNAAGLDDEGAVVETGAGQVVPSFSAPPATWEGAPPVTLVIPKGPITIDVKPGDGIGEGHITQFGARFAVELSKLAVSGAGDRLTVSADGHRTSYESASGTAYRLGSAIEGEGRRAYELTVDVPAGGVRVTTEVDPDSGRIAITTDGTSGKVLTVTVTRTEPDGTTVGGSAEVPGGDGKTVTVDGAAITAGAPLPVNDGTADAGAPPGPSCTDGLKNGDETDVDCGGTCTARCAIGKACVAPADCGSNECTTSVCTTVDRVVFVTSTGVDGAMGGLPGADTRCATAATAGGLPGTYKAFLSGELESALGRIFRGTARYVLPDGATVVANDGNAFFSATHLAPIDRTEANLASGVVEVWTGSTPNGGGDATPKCLGWTSAAQAETPAIGRTDFADAQWAAFGSGACATARRLYCVQEGTVPPP